MKKKLEAELISIAHRILKLKNKSELDQLYFETQALYEKLAVLRFAESHFSPAKPTIGISDVEAALETESPAETEISQPETIASEPEAQEPIVEASEQAQEEAIEEESNVQPEAEAPEEITAESEETAEASEETVEESDDTSEETEEIEAKSTDEKLAESEEESESSAKISEEKPEETQVESTLQPESGPRTFDTELPKTIEEDLFKPAFEWNFEPKMDEPEKPAASPQMNFDDLLGSAYKHPEFVKPEENNPTDAKPTVIPIDRAGDKVQVIKIADEPIDRSLSLNDRLSRGITVGLNDRIAFVKHLFNNSNEDYNRVLSQLITLDTLDQAKDFIDNMVKPDYNNWEGKEEYEQRFMEIVEKKFS